MSTLDAWATIDANNNATPPDGWPENTMQYSEVNNTGRAVQGTVRRFFGDINGSLVSGGVANAYTLALNESGYTSYFAGMYFACEILATNTGASTINVNGIGVQNIFSQDGVALAGGELMAGGIYTFRYDGTNFQLIGGSGAVAANGIFTNPNNPDLVDTSVALNIGATDPDTQLHMEIGPNSIQTKADATTAPFTMPDMLIATLGAQDVVIGGSMVKLKGAQSKTQAALTANAGGIQISGLQAGDPATGAIQDVGIDFRNDGGISLQAGYIGYTFPFTGLDLRLVNRVLGGKIQFYTDALSSPYTVTAEMDDPSVGGLFVNNQLTGSGLERVLTTSDAGGAFDPSMNQTITGDWIFDNNSFGLQLASGTELKFNGAGAGVQFSYTPGSVFNATALGTDANSIDFWFDATWEAVRHQNPIRINTTAVTPVANIAGYGQLYGSGNNLIWRDFAGTDYTLNAVPSSTGASHTLRGDGVGGFVENTVATIGASGQISTSASLSLSDTVDQITLSVTAGVMQAFGTGGFGYIDWTTVNMRQATNFTQETTNPPVVPAGFGLFYVNGFINPNRPAFKDDGAQVYQLQTVQPPLFTNSNQDFGTGETARGMVGNAIWYDDGSNYTVTLEASTGSDFPAKSSFDIINAGSGTITIARGATTLLFYLDGAGGTVTNVGVDCTLSVGGVATVFRFSAGVYAIFGSGITA